jgi:hypothetical protein
MLITFIVSFHLSNGVWFLPDTWQDSQMYKPWYMKSLWEISSFSVAIFMTTILFTVQDKVILFFIKINAFTNKIILKAISKADMYLWKKYDKQNMITNFIWKLQMKYVNRSRKEKKIITFAFVACVGVYYVAIFIN